jgi:predicted DsbA family dithiol-disulfide isomerase
MTKKLVLDVWSDIVCPWCAIGKHRLERALADFAHKDAVEVTWRSFELDPDAPPVREGDNATRLARKYGRTKEQALAMMRQVEETAAKEGLELHLVDARSGSTFDAHRVLHLAAERGIQGAVKDRFFRGALRDHEALGDHEVIARLAAEAGLDADEVRSVLAGDRYAREVREDEDAARALGVNGVPFFVLGGKYAVSGAQPADVMRRALEQAWESVEEEGVGDAASEDGAACGSGGCA